MTQPFPVGIHVILRRMKDKWQVFSVYPSGYTVPQGRKPLSTAKSTLADVHSYLLELHTDDPIFEGHPAAKDATSPPGKIPDGALVIFEFRKNGWTYWVDYPTGGMSGQPANHKTLRAAMEAVELNYAVE